MLLAIAICFAAVAFVAVMAYRQSWRRTLRKIRRLPEVPPGHRRVRK